MRKETAVELWQLKTGLLALSSQLREGVDHLDDMTCKTIARALEEIMQETVSLPNRSSAEEIAAFVTTVLVGTEEMRQTLAARWFEELQEPMQRARERADELDHELDEFTCLSVDGQEWGAICVKCLEWIIVTPGQVRGAILHTCRGWSVSWKM
ncbi:MAG: hypothetical protein KC443_02725 [Anaerolineales bacterium]|nr:hypothetical protein [Anaerolineales bacterium]